MNVAGEGTDDHDSSTLEPEDFDLFTEPADFRPATPPPTKAQYQLPIEPFQTIGLTLVGSHPLWAHHLWNASPTLSNYLCNEKPNLCQGKAVLELGAAAGLPSIVAHLLHASKVVTTDYPDIQLIDNLQLNVDKNITARQKSRCAVEGYIWGSSSDKLRAHLDDNQSYFDLVLLSDLIFNHQAHGAMLDTLHACLPPSSPERNRKESYDVPQALVFFTHHRPHLAAKDMNFFQEAEERGWTCKEVGKWKMAPMFPNDAGSEEVRATVHGWQVYR